MKWFKTFLHYSGLAYIIAKATSSENKEHYPTLPIWLLGIYIGLFGIATQHYESRLDRFESKLNIYISQLGTSARTNTFPAMVAHQKYKLPLEPDFWDPWQTVKTLIYETQPINEELSHSQKVRDIANIIVRFKDVLGCEIEKSKKDMGGFKIGNKGCKSVNLRDADLKEADFENANLYMVNLNKANLYGSNLANSVLAGADLRWADLRRATLSGVDLRKSNAASTDFSWASLEGSDLREADLSWAVFYDASLIGADLRRTDTSEVDLRQADLKGADLRGVKHMGCEQLVEAENWELSYRDKKLACNAEIPDSHKNESQ